MGSFIVYWEGDAQDERTSCREKVGDTIRVLENRVSHLQQELDQRRTYLLKLERGAPAGYWQEVKRSECKYCDAPERAVSMQTG